MNYKMMLSNSLIAAIMFSPPMGLPLWMDMSLLSCNESEMHIKLKMSIRFNLIHLSESYENRNNQKTTSSFMQ